MIKSNTTPHANPQTTETYYVTKYGLTDGIWEIPPGYAEITDDKKFMYLRSLDPGFRTLAIQVKQVDYHRTLADAERRIEQLKEAKLRGLDKALTKIKTYKAAVKPWGKA